tara:strand:- start:102 stop:647 length:546 start_codon:yes stop_codon:yes gene_type:complete
MKKHFLFLIIMSQSCNSDIQPKPFSFLRLDYPKPTYKRIKLKNKISFETNNRSSIFKERMNEFNLVYPKMKATLYLNYNTIEKNLDSLLNDAYQLPYKHITKAESIPEKIFINPDKKVYGTLFSVIGDAASQHQFFLTDSLKHFLVGSLYFYARPNYDSIYPASSYIKDDIIHIIETLEWD